MTHAVVAQLPALGFELDRDEAVVEAWLEGGPSTPPCGSLTST